MVKGVNNILVMLFILKKQQFSGYTRKRCEKNVADSTRHFDTFVQSADLHDRY